MGALLPVPKRDRLLGALELASRDSTPTHERLAAIGGACRILAGERLSWSDIISASNEPPPRPRPTPEGRTRDEAPHSKPQVDWRVRALTLLRVFPYVLTAWEQQFLASVMRQPRGLSPKQQCVFDRIAAKAGL